MADPGAERGPSTCHVVLMGLRGSGKSTLGPALAELLGMPFLDLDVPVLESLRHSTVASAWAALGQPAFREAESRCLRRALAGETATVLALGGGTPTAPGAADMLRLAQERNRAVVLYLHADPGTLAVRIAPGDPNRPRLAGEDPATEMVRMYAERNPLYASLAGRMVDVACSKAEAMERVAAAARRAIRRPG